MKRVLFIAAVAAFAMTSCKKDRVCECTYIYSSGSTSSTEVDTYTAKTKKKDAEAWCKANESQKVDVNGMSAGYVIPSCTIK